MKPMAFGLVFAAIVIAAFVGGMFIDTDVENDGPVEELGEAIDEATTQ